MKKLQLKHYKTMSTVCIKHLSMISRITFYTVVVRIVLRASKLVFFFIYTEECREKVKGVKKCCKPDSNSHLQYEYADRSVMSSF